jgi:AraC family transcriptional regulator
LGRSKKSSGPDTLCRFARLSSMTTQRLLTADPPAIQWHAPPPKGRCCYGTMVGRLHTRGLAFAELIHSVAGNVPSHTHHTSFYQLVMAGACEESSSRGRFYSQPFSPIFTRSGTTHDGRIAPCGARSFTVEISGAWMNEFCDLHAEPETVQDRAGGELTCLGIQLYREYRADSAPCALTVDTLIWELLAAAAGMETRDAATTPDWWGRVVDLLHSEFRRDLRISELAAEAGVHPVHIARVFRRICHRTPGEYMQRLRVRFASERLSVPHARIVEVAAQTGFADQSHMTRTFKRYTRMTPGEFLRFTSGRSEAQAHDKVCGFVRTHTPRARILS